MAANIINVPHLWGIQVGYKMAHAYDPNKPTCILINSFTTSSLLYNKEFENRTLTDAMNLVAIEPLGHGATRTKLEHFTFWDTAIMNLQVMDALGIQKAFAMGTSQGGFIAARMALLAPERIQGIIPLGTTLDSESQHTRDLGCYDADDSYVRFIKRWSSTEATPDWVVEDDFCDLIAYLGFGPHCPDDTKAYWRKVQKGNYCGDDGRKRLRTSIINVLERDGLHSRLQDIRCPVLWIHGSEIVPFSYKVAQEEIKLFTHSKSAELRIVQGGGHYLNATHPKEIAEGLAEFVSRFSAAT